MSASNRKWKLFASVIATLAAIIAIIDDGPQFFSTSPTGDQQISLATESQPEPPTVESQPSEPEETKAFLRPNFNGLPLDVTPWTYGGDDHAYFVKNVAFRYCKEQGYKQQVDYALNLNGTSGTWRYKENGGEPCSFCKDSFAFIECSK